jgi:hypothetical protein
LERSQELLGQPLAVYLHGNLAILCEDLFGPERGEVAEEGHDALFQLC